MPTETELAYIAGFTDGEGCIGIHSANYEKGYTANVAIANTNYEILHLIQWWLGYGSINNLKAANERRKRSYQLSFNGDIALRFLKLILPYLKLKKMQALLAIEFLETCRADRTKRVFGSNEPYLSSEQIARRKAIYEEMKALNAKGPS